VTIPRLFFTIRQISLKREIYTRPCIDLLSTWRAGAEIGGLRSADPTKILSSSQARKVLGCNEEGGFYEMNDASDKERGCVNTRSERLKEKKAKITENEAEVAVEELRLQNKKSALEKAKAEIKREEAKVVNKELKVKGKVAGTRTDRGEAGEIGSTAENQVKIAEENRKIVREQANVEKEKTGTSKKAQDREEYPRTKGQKKVRMTKEEEKFVVSWSIIEQG
jgi:hypothetical protein